MAVDAHTPEELEALLEDAFVLRDREAAARLFEDGAVLLPTPGSGEARGPAQIAALVASLWQQGRTYVADARRVVQARDTALVMSEGSVSVLHRGSDGSWRYAISLLSFDRPPPDGEP